ncbi:MAG: serine hydrolase domain-containing protein [Isosphaeraceae bacterium]
MARARRIAAISLGLLLIGPGMAMGQELSGKLQPFVEAHSLAGAVALVADRDGVLGVETAGHADVEAGKPMARDSLFWIASQSKPITATALMMLVDEGKVALDDPVAKFLPEFGDLWLTAERDNDHQLLKRPSRPITIRDILSHTSGLPFASAAEKPTLDALSLRVCALTYAMTPLQFEPGTKYAYSNAGINTAGRIIEVVSGQPYEAFMDSRLFRPLGMKDTTFWPNAEQLKRLARSYKPDSAKTGLEATTIGQLQYPLDNPKRQPMPAGGLFSTADDVARFCRMILNDGTLDGRRYLSEKSVREMTRRQTATDIKESYGLGWSVNGSEFGHGGAMATNMSILRDRGLVLVYLVQHAGFPNDGAKAQGVFREAAIAKFGKARP